MGIQLSLSPWLTIDIFFLLINRMVGAQPEVFGTLNFIDFGVISAALGPTDGDFSPAAINSEKLSPPIPSTPTIHRTYTLGIYCLDQASSLYRSAHSRNIKHSLID